MRTPAKIAIIEFLKMINPRFFFTNIVLIPKIIPKKLVKKKARIKLMINGTIVRIFSGNLKGTNMENIAIKGIDMIMNRIMVSNKNTDK